MENFFEKAKEEKTDFDISFLSILYPSGYPNIEKNVKFHRSQNITSIQKDIISGIKKNNKTEPHIINTLLVPLFPKGYKLPIIESSLLKGDLNGINHRYINLPLLYSRSLFWGAKKHLKKWALENTGKEKVLIAYSLTVYTLKAAAFVKRINPEIKTVIIVPDLPQYTYRSAKNIFSEIKNRSAKKSIEKKIEKNSQYVDSWLVFSEKMMEKLPDKKYMVFEGVATDLFGELSPKRLCDEKIYEIIYAGGLNENYGVKLFLDAIKEINGHNYSFVIAGKGPMREEIISRAEQDSRIKFLGEISRNDLLQFELGADVLLNPRINSGIFTRYSFPSKNMEYLSSGTPTVVYKIEGIPDEYDEYFNYFDSPTAESLAKTIINVCENGRDEYVAKAHRAKNYVLSNKNKNIWAEKILNHIKSI